MVVSEEFLSRLLCHHLFDLPASNETANADSVDRNTHFSSPWRFLFHKSDLTTLKLNKLLSDYNITLLKIEIDACLFDSEIQSDGDAKSIAQHMKFHVLPIASSTQNAEAKIKYVSLCKNEVAAKAQQHTFTTHGLIFSIVLLIAQRLMQNMRNVLKVERWFCKLHSW